MVASGTTETTVRLVTGLASSAYLELYIGLAEAHRGKT